MPIKRQTLIEAAIEQMSPPNPAILRCCNAWITAHQNALAKGTNPVSALLRGNEAYRAAMPPLSGAENIRDYIACLAHGMASRTIILSVGAGLLSVARTALSAHNRLNNKGLTKKAQKKSSQTTVKANLTNQDSAA